MLIRCVIKFEFKKFFIGRMYSKKWIIVVKNEYNNHFKVGEDYNFFVEKKEGMFLDCVIPVNEKEILKEMRVNKDVLSPSTF